MVLGVPEPNIGLELSVRRSIKKRTETWNIDRDRTGKVADLLR